MAITVLITNQTAAVDLATATSFTISDVALVTADNMSEGEHVLIYRLGPSGDYKPATNQFGTIVLSDRPNTVKLDGPGTFKAVKTVTVLGAYVGYEE